MLPKVKHAVYANENTEWTLDSDVYWQIMKGTANITKKYFCPCLTFCVLLILVKIDDIFVE